MSYSPLQKPFLEFLSQENLQKALIILRHPTSLALLASVGIHGVLWVGLPLLPAAEREQPDTRRTVGIVELSPMEQLRLPDFATPQVLSPSPLPLPQASPLPSRNSPAAVAPLPSPFYKFDPIPPVTWIPPIVDLSPLPVRRPAVRATPSPKPTPSPTPQSETPTPPAATPSSEASPAPARPEKIPQEAIDRLRDLQARGIDVYDKTGTTEAEAHGRTGNWLAQVQEKTEVNNDSFKTFQKPIVLVVPYPAETKPDNFSEAGEATVGVLVDPEGKLVGEPELLRSTGYQRLDQSAVEQIKTYLGKEKEAELKPTGNTQIYVFRISFATDATEAEDNATPAETEPSPTAKPSPEG
jgi:outer membrane biosynthesis protein TonB